MQERIGLAEPGGTSVPREAATEREMADALRAVALRLEPSGALAIGMADVATVLWSRVSPLRRGRSKLAGPGPVRPLPGLWGTPALCIAAPDGACRHAGGGAGRVPPTR